MTAVTTIERKVIQWVPNSWWVVDYRAGFGYTPLYEAKHRDDAEAWLEAHPLEPEATDE